MALKLKPIGMLFFSTLLCLTVTIGIFSSCTTDHFDDYNNGNGTVNAEGYMQITFNLPEFQTPEAPTTRAMDAKQESAIDKNKLHVFVFNADADDNTFMYKAPILTDTYTEDATSRTATVTIKLVKDIASDIVVVANSDLPENFQVKEKVTTKAEFYEKYKYSMPQEGKWNTTTNTTNNIPMAGTITGKTIKENTTEKLKIDMRRAMARIDVGLNFEIVDGKLTENASGLDNFKLKEIKVVHTYDEGLVGTLSTNLEKADIPAGAVRRTSDKPLTFTVPDGVNSYVREIYVPQSDQPLESGKVDHSKIHTLIVSGYNQGSTEATYYRMDFAEMDKSDNLVFMDIAGNYRYVFNITQVNGPGFSSYEEALLSTPFASGITYEVIAWDESIHEMHVQGKYHFGLDNREITLKEKSTAEESENLKVITYQTNYPISDTDGITFEWENKGADYFNVEWSEKGDKKGKITITAKTTNETNTVLTDVLHVKLGCFTIKVTVKQEYINFKYTLNCETVKVFGTYRPGQELNTISADPPTHRIELTITAEDSSILGSKYEIYTEPIYGIEFKAEGTFNSLTEKVVLKGEGMLNTPEEGRTTPFTVTIRSNSSSDSYCEATINPVLSKMKIVTMASTNKYGYDVGESGRGANYVFTHPNNFGPYDYSRIKIEGFEFIQCAKKDLDHSLDPEAKALITGSEGELADILYLAYGGAPSKEDGECIRSYLEKGGVVVAFLQEPDPTQNLLNGVFSPKKIGFHSNDGSGGVFPFPGNKVYKDEFIPISDKEEDSWEWYYESLLADPILNGPFGNICDKQWADDASLADLLTLPKVEGITVYTTGNMLNKKSQGEDKVSGFRYQTDDISLVFFTDGGVMSSEIRNNSPSEDGSTLCPFWWDPTDAFPTPKTGYRGHEVYNSQLFMNIMAWAVNRSVELRPKRDAALEALGKQ